MPPTWVMIAVGAVPGMLGLFAAALNLGAIRRDIRDLVQRASSWDQAKLDIAYIKGRVEGADIERLAPTSTATSRRRTATKLSAVSK